MIFKHQFEAMEIVTSNTISLFSVLLFLVCLIRILQRKPDDRKLPPQPAGAWPIVGHLFLLAGRQEHHVTLGNLADKYGDVFMIKTGARKTIVVSSWELAKECFTVHDRNFANRPKLVVGELMGYNSTMLGFLPYGKFWRQMRKIATVELFSNHRVQMLSSIIESEVRAAINDVVSTNGAPVLKMVPWFEGVVMNLTFRFILGKRFGGGGNEGEEVRELIRRWLTMVGKALVADVVPILRFLDLGGTEKKMKKVARELDVIVQGWLDDHKRERKSGKKKKKEEEDFMDVMISVLEESPEIFSHDADTINKATSLALMVGAIGSTKVILTHVFTLLLQNPSVLKKAQEELDTNIGRQRYIQESDTNNLLYLQAIFKESLRLYQTLSIPRESMEDCNLGGYFIPKGTSLIVNMGKMHRDPRVWENPDEFRPERFLTTHKHIDVRGKHFELLPFGSGRRMCPGAGLGLQVLVLVLGSFLHGFDIGGPFTEPANDQLEVQITPRLPSHLYQ